MNKVMRIVPSLPTWPPGALFLLAFLLRYLSVGVHEAGHWAVLTAFGRGPVMGPGGLVQRWGSPPPDPTGWVRILFRGQEGWLRMASAPAGPGEWALVLSAGLLTTLALAWVGALLALRASTPFLRGLGLTLAVVNGLGVFLFPLNYLLGSGDVSFLAGYLGVPVVALALPYEVLRAGALAVAVLAVPRSLWGAWLGPLAGGYLLTLPFLFVFNAWVRAQVAEGSVLARPLAGWSAPALASYALALAGVLLLMRWLLAHPS